MRWRTIGLVATLLVALGACGSGGSDGSDESDAGGAVLDVRLGLTRDQDGLATAAVAAATPGDPTFAATLTLDEVADRYGPAADDVQAVLDALDAAGVDATLDASGAVVEAPMPASRAAALFALSLSTGTTDDGRAYVELSGTPTLPDGLDGRVQEVVGLSRTLPAGGAGSTGTTTPAAVPTDPAACQQATTSVTALRQRYGLPTPGTAPPGATDLVVGVPTADAEDPAALATWASCLGVPVPTVTTAGAAGSAPATDDGSELELDLALLVAASPPGTSVVLAPLDPLGWVGEPYLGLVGAAGGPPAVISSSETYCEPQLPADDVELTEWVLAAAAATGTTTVVAAGDAGSTACAPGSDELAVEYPASSPFALAVGGTQLGADGAEVVWKDTGEDHAGGGGDSATFDRPTWQTHDGGARRVPDLAALADPDALPPLPVCTAGGCAWQALGGTSAGAPLVAGGVVGVHQALLADGARPPGLLTPVLYAWATGAPAGVRDVTAGDNDLASAGCCDAAPGFDAASGWGSIDLGALATAASATRG